MSKKEIGELKLECLHTLMSWTAFSANEKARYLRRTDGFGNRNGDMGDIRYCESIEDMCTKLSEELLARIKEDTNPGDDNEYDRKNSA